MEMSVVARIPVTILLASLLAYISWWAAAYSSRLFPRTKRPPAGDDVHSCKYCNRIIVPWPKTVIGEHGFNYRLPITLSEARQAAEAGCELFKMLPLGHLRPTIKDHADLFDTIFRARRALPYIAGLGTFLQKCCYLLGTLGPHPLVLRFFAFQLRNEQRELPEALSCRLLCVNKWSEALSVQAEAEGQMASLIPYRPVNRDLTSLKSFNRAKSWLADCLSGGDDHQDCQNLLQLESPVLPARLLDVGVDPKEQTIKLHCTSPAESVEWCSLSYCWGGDQAAKLTKARLSEYLAQISLASLPATLRDAVEVTRQLGMRYVWIDALCILQDCNEDKEKELPKMPHIYGASVFTISASSSPNSEHGFLRARESLVGKAIRLHILMPGGNEGYVLVSRLEPTFRSSDEPTNTRAWCFQERLLSRRTLDYGTRQLQWICRSQILQDGGVFPLSDPGLDGSGGGALWRANTWDDSRTQEDARTRTWQWIMEIYSSRKLTVEGDKLVALAAVSEVYGRKYGLTFVAGLWLEDLQKQLCWEIARPTFPRPDAYCGPTWSWASTTGYVRSASAKAASCSVVSCVAQPALPSLPYGAVKAGVLVLRGQVKRATWISDRKRDLITFESNRDPVVLDTDVGRLRASGEFGKSRFLGTVNPDFTSVNSARDQETTERIWCMKMIVNHSGSAIDCLMFTKVDGREIYQRRGLFRIGAMVDSSDPFPRIGLFDDAPTLTMTIH